MGTCMSKSNNNQSKTEASVPDAVITPPAPHERRRRLSVSQSADVAAADETDRGHVQIAPGSILNLFPNRRRFSLAGAPAYALQAGFSDKANKVEGDKRLGVSDFGVGYACKKGLKPESPNQDDFFILEVDEWGLYGVFDGHGPYGHDISNYVQQHLPRLIVQSPHFETNPKQALKEGFVKIHENISSNSHPKNFDPIMSGTTGTVILHRASENKLYVAHVGDSRAVLARRSKGGDTIGEVEWSGIDLTTDHKPDLPSEKARIESRGGEVKRMPHDIPHRVFMKDRNIPGLAMSRALGDTLGHSVGVSCIPDVSEVTLTEGSDEFFVMCSDGVWEFIESDEAAKLIATDALIESPPDALVDNKKRNKSGAPVASWDLSRACDQLAMESWNRWITEEQNVVDDITVILVKLFPQNNKQQPAVQYPTQQHQSQGRNSMNSNYSDQTAEHSNNVVLSPSSHAKLHSANYPSYPAPTSSNQPPTLYSVSSNSRGTNNNNYTNTNATINQHQQLPYTTPVGGNPDLLPASLSEDEDGY